MWKEMMAVALLYAVPLLFAVVVHEVSHGYIAEKRGDPTARMLGRITLNPFVHIDLIGTILLPVALIAMRSPFLFGWAKPVPVNFSNLRGGRRDMALVSAAGPLSNLLLACLSAAVYHWILSEYAASGFLGTPRFAWIAEPLQRMAGISVEFNLVLMVINLLPVPPLDGGRILVGLLPLGPAVQLEKLERYGMLIVLLLIISDFWSYIVRPVLNLFVNLLL